MLYRDVVTLISVTGGTDADGYPQVTESATEVYADVKSVKRSEFWLAHQSNVEMAIAVYIRSCDYNGERLLKYDGVRYRVERAYSKNGEDLELNCSENKGAVL